jgi:hypothetical protein
VLIVVVRININQQFMAIFLDENTAQVLIEIPQNWGFLATWWLHGTPV